MELYIVYSNDRKVTVQNVKYIAVFNNTLYYLVGDDMSPYLVDLNAVATFSTI